MLVVGTRKPELGEIKIPETTCSICGERGKEKITVFGRYIQFFWVPSFPIGKTVTAKCDACNFITKKKYFTREQREQYNQYKNLVRRPFWHWSGSILVILFMAYLTFGLKTREPDMRSWLLDDDVAKMVENPTYKSDSVSFVIKKLMDNIDIQNLKPEKFQYYSKIDENKTLILMKIPRFRKLRREERTEVLETIEIVTEATPLLWKKDLYIGIQGNVSFNLIKTPTITRNGKFITESHLYTFYGPKIEYKKLEE
ncbi:MAG: hypothetical protein ABF242_02275 [Flavobacteriales bacterium]